MTLRIGLKGILEAVLTSLEPPQKDTFMTGDRADTLEALKASFLAIGDPTEYKFAKKSFATWKLWEDFVKMNQEEVDLWHRELEAKIKSEAIQRVFEASYSEGKDCLAANKYLLEVPWSRQEKSKVGRPTKEAIQQAAQRLVSVQEQVTEDYKRLFDNPSPEGARAI